MDISRDDFLKHVGTEFRVDPGNDGDPVKLELASVTPIHRSGVGTRDDPFSAEFHGPAGPVLTQRIYSFDHAELGTLEIFIVPIGSDPKTGRMRYEAIFN